MMKIKKKYLLITAALLVSVVVVLVSSIKIYIAASSMEQDVKSKITEFFKERLNKAVQFESIDIGLTGNINIKNLDISATDDFNDNLHLIKAPDATIDLKLISLLKGDIILNGISFHDSTITFFKRYGMEYNEYFETFDVFKTFVSSINENENKSIDRFTIRVENSKVIYKEAFQGERIKLSVNNFNGLVAISQESLKYNLDGTLENYEKSSVPDGSFTIKGNESLVNKKSWSNIEIDNFDLSHTNLHLNEFHVLSSTLQGGASIRLELTKEKDLYNFSGRLETNNFSLISPQKNNHKVISNENVDVEFDFHYNKKSEIVTIKQFEFEEDSISLEAKGRIKYPQLIKISFKTNNINLENLSQYFSPIENYIYSGHLQVKGDIHIDNEKKQVHNFDCHVRVDDFTLKNYKDNSDKNIFTNGNGELNISKESFNFKGSTAIKDSLLAVSGITNIKKWYPFRSTTKARMRSKKLNISLVYDITKTVLKKLFEAAHRDSKKGWEDMYFLQNPIGKFLNYNDIKLDVTVDQFKLLNKAKLTGGKALFTLERGVLSCKDFNLIGNDGEYTLFVHSNFKSDRPFLQLKGGVSGFNLEQFAFNSGDPTLCSGIMAMNFDYELSFYRVAHLLENSKGNVKISITDGHFKGTRIQKKIGSFLMKNSYDKVDVEKVTFSRASIQFSQLGENFYIRDFGINGDKTTFNTYGKFLYGKGYNFVINASIEDIEEKRINIPVRVTGELLNPCFNIRGKKDSKEVCF